MKMKAAIALCLYWFLQPLPGVLSQGGECLYRYLREPPLEIDCNPWSTISNLNLQCQASVPLSVSAEIHWFFNDERIQPTPPLSEETRSSQVVITSSLLFRLIRVQVGRYHCRILVNGNYTAVPSNTFKLGMEDSYIFNQPCEARDVQFQSTELCAGEANISLPTRATVPPSMPTMDSVSVIQESSTISDSGTDDPESVPTTSFSATSTPTPVFQNSLSTFSTNAEGTAPSFMVWLYVLVGVASLLAAAVIVLCAGICFWNKSFRHCHQEQVNFEGQLTSINQLPTLKHMKAADMDIDVKDHDYCTIDDLDIPRAYEVPSKKTSDSKSVTSPRSVSFPVVSVHELNCGSASHTPTESGGRYHEGMPLEYEMPLKVPDSVRMPDSASSKKSASPFPVTPSPAGISGILLSHTVGINGSRPLEYEMPSEKVPGKSTELEQSAARCSQLSSVKSIQAQTTVKTTTDDDGYELPDLFDPKNVVPSLRRTSKEESASPEAESDPEGYVIVCSNIVPLQSQETHSPSNPSPHCPKDTEKNDTMRPSENASSGHYESSDFTPKRGSNTMPVSAASSFLDSNKIELRQTASVFSLDSNSRRPLATPVQSDTCMKHASMSSECDSGTYEIPTATPQNVEPTTGSFLSNSHSTARTESNLDYRNIIFPPCERNPAYAAGCTKEQNERMSS